MLVEPGVADAFPAQVSPYEPAVSLTQALETERKAQGGPAKSVALPLRNKNK